MRGTMPLAATAYNLGVLMSVPFAPTAALAGAGAGNVDNGAHKYLVTFVSATGETIVGATSVAVTVVDKTTDGKIALSNIPLGPSGTTARKVYRTVAAGSAYKLQSTIANNTATTLTDNTADASLGAAPPTLDTSNLNLGSQTFYSQLELEADGNNGDTIYGDYTPNVTDQSYAFTLLGGAGGYNFGGWASINPYEVWLYSPTAAQSIQVGGRTI